MIAAIWDTPYNIVYVVHLLSVIIGTGVAFTAPVMAVKARRDSGRSTQEVIDEAAASLMFPAFIIAGMAGGALVGMSEDVYDFSQTWLAIAGALWLLILALAALVYPPRWLSLVTVSEERKRALGGLLHLSLAVMLVVMTWKFGV